VNADTGVGGAGAAGHHADAGPAGELAIGFGHVGGGALMFGDDDLDFGHVVEGVEDVQIAFARDAEDAVGAMDSQGVGKDAATAARLFGHTIQSSVGMAAARWLRLRQKKCARMSISRLVSRRMGEGDRKCNIL
jgi:hypothetical protein